MSTTVEAVIEISGIQVLLPGQSEELDAEGKSSRQHTVRCLLALRIELFVLWQVGFEPVAAAHIFVITSTETAT